MPDTGKRVTADCRTFPSERNCQFVISADRSEEDELVDVAVYHAITHHGHKDSQELREEIKKTFSYD